MTADETDGPLWKPGQVIKLPPQRSYEDLSRAMGYRDYMNYQARGQQQMQGNQLGQLASNYATMPGGDVTASTNVRLTNCVWYNNGAARLIDIAPNYVDDRFDSFGLGYGFGIGMPATPVDPLAEYCPILDEPDAVIPITPWYTRWWITVLRWILRRLP